MIREDALKKIKAKRKCFYNSVFSLCDCDNCDDCRLNYEQGNMGEQIEALDVAIKTLEQELKTGHWIPMGLVDANDNRNYECSECHYGDTHAKNQIVPYCWHCGAKMESEANE